MIQLMNKTVMDQ